jgi:hypothetical protein
VIAFSDDPFGSGEPMTSNNVFQLTLPSPWRETTVHTFEGPFDTGVQHNLVLVIDPAVDKNQPLGEYAKQQFGSFKESLPGYELLNEHEITLPSGIKAYEFVYRYSPSDDRALYQKQLTVIIEGKGYIFTSTYSKKTLKTIADDVDHIIASFRPLKPE